MQVIGADRRYLVDNRSQHSYWLLSYRDYIDTKNLNFGDIKVFNDDILKAGKIFKLESAGDKEIVTIILDGELSHEDSTGSDLVLQTGDVQVLSAGNGVSFSGMNATGNDVHLCRIWIQPLKQGMDPSCDQKNFDICSATNELLPLASGQGFRNALKLRSNATVYISGLENGKMIDHLTDTSRFIHIYVLEGDVTVCGEKLGIYDQARINQNDTVVIEATSDARFILVDAAGNS